MKKISTWKDILVLECPEEDDSEVDYSLIDWEAEWVNNIITLKTDKE